MFAREKCGFQSGEPIICLQDNLGAHWAPAAKEVMEKENLSFIAPFPARSPDFNIIENLFSAADGRKNTADFWDGPAPDHETAIKRWVHMARACCTEGDMLEAAESMPNRLNICLALEGAATGY